MIPEAREVHLSRKDRKVLEERCRSPVTLQRDLKRARIVLLAAAGRSTRSIAKEVGVQPRIVSLWRHRYADHGLEGLQSRPLPGKQPIYTKATDKRILKLLDKSPPAGYARWTGPLLAGELGDVDVQYVWRFLRSHKIDLAARKSWREQRPAVYGQSRRRGWPLCRPAQEGHRAMRGRKALDPGLGTSAGLSETAQWQITTTSGTARPRCLQHWKSPPERSSQRIQNAVAVSSFSIIA